MEHYFQNKKILLCLTGSVAVYKSLFLMRELKRLGAEVKVVMTESAKAFVSEALVEGLLGEKPVSDLFADAMAHIHLAKWPELILIAPATANILAKARIGLANDLLSTLLLATKAPIVMVPAMNQAMWQHPATQENVAILKERGVSFLEPTEGIQACGDIGPGRMLEFETLIRHLPRFFCKPILKHQKILITAGPTCEPLDPVRMLSNRSSGKMGYALAQSAFYHGAEVTLLSGKTKLAPPVGVNYHEVETSGEMFEKVQEQVHGHSIFIGVAAVCDFKPAILKTQKIKKQNKLSIELVKTEDILGSVSSLENRPLCIGFAAETENLIQNAQLKLKQKKLDMIVANQVSATQGFDSDDNQVMLISREKITELPKLNKFECADLILQAVSSIRQEATDLGIP